MSAAPALASLQALFARAVVAGEDEAVLEHLAGDPETARRRLGIYRRAILANQAGALHAAFPVVARLVGEGFFDEAARRYGEATPPASADLNRHGESFPAFLAGYPHAASMPWLGDVARLEWASHESLMAADEPPLDFAALARVEAEGQPGLRFRLHPSLRLVRSAWPVLAIWEANQPERDGTPDREEGADDVLAWREAGRPRHALLDSREAAFVEALARGETLAEAVGDGEPWDFGAMLGRLAGAGLLCAFSDGAAATR